MKTISYLTALCAVLLVGCKSAIDNPIPGTLVTPLLDFTESENPYSGLLAVYPCQPGSSTYFGNYRNDQLSAVNASYVVSQGSITKSYPPLILPTGDYNMIYWGISKAINVAYENPASIEPSLSIGSDTEQLFITLRPNGRDTTYMPTFDYVFNSKSTQIGSQSLTVPLRRVVAGLEITIRKQGNEQLDPTIDSIAILVSNVAGKLNFYDATPSDFSRTVAFGLTIAEDRMTARNNMVTLFPSEVKPAFVIVVTLNDGREKMYHTTLNNTLIAGMNLNITVDMGEIFVQQTTGNGFTVSAWDEQSETITTGPF